MTNDILESITRDTLAVLFRDEQGVEVSERDIDRTELYLAEELFLCGSGLELTPFSQSTGIRSTTENLGN